MFLRNVGVYLQVYTALIVNFIVSRKLREHESRFLQAAVLLAVCGSLIMYRVSKFLFTALR